MKIKQMGRALVGIAMLFSFNAYALQLPCPPVGSLYHGGPGTPWEISPEFGNQGWTVSQNPDAMNTSLEGTAYDNQLVATLTNLNASKIYYFSCIYNIGYPQKSVTVVLVNRAPQRDPVANAGFKREEEGIYVCHTTLEHPDNCRSDVV